jgi:hypothetical protein
MEDILNQNLMKKISDRSFDVHEKLKDMDDSSKDDMSSKSDITTNSITSYFTVSKAPVVSCKIHGQSYIGVQTSKFRLICKKCVETGLKGNDFEVTANAENGVDDDEIFCKDHSNSKGSFYCNKCNHFICKLCFSDAHRNHDSNLPSFMSNKFKESLRNFIFDIIKVKPDIEERLESILKINEEIKLIRQTTQKNLNNTFEKIKSENNNKTETIVKSFSSVVYNGLDDEVENTLSRLMGLNIRLSKYLADINEMINFVNNKTNPIQICQYKKSKNTIMSELSKITLDSKNLLEFKTPSVKNSVKERKELIEKSVNSYTKQFSIYEKSVITSISSGITNKSIVLRRFNKYRKRKELVCFKSSSLLLKVDSPIFIIGFGLCGLYISSKTFYESDKNLLASESDRTKIPIIINISEIKEESSTDEKISDDQILYGVLDRNDPTYQIYMKKAVYVKPECKYLISIQNLDKNIYIDLWSGKVGKVFLDNMQQHLHCNCTKVNFYFSCANGYESDFDEFNFGIIANIIFSQTV